MATIQYTFLGQVSFLFECDGVRWVIDPYITDYVKDLYGDKFARTFPFEGERVSLENLDYCLITHAHEDHCDPLSIGILLEKNPGMKIVCDAKSAEIIAQKWPDMVVTVPKVGTVLEWSDQVKITTVPSAHTELVINDGISEFNGYLMQLGETTLYHPGDTIPHRTIEEYLPAGIDVAFMPVNERNFFRDEMGVIGNMTVREAFQWAEELGIKTVIPTHWDMFAMNSTDPEEIKIVAAAYKKSALQMPERFIKTKLI